MIRDRGMEDRVFFWFWSDRRARKFRRIAPDLPLKMNSRTGGDVHRHKREFDHQIVEQGPNEATPEVMAACREHGIRIMANVTGEKGKSKAELDELYRRVVDLGYDMVNLDRPGPFVEFLRKEGLR